MAVGELFRVKAAILVLVWKGLSLRRILETRVRISVSSWPTLLGGMVILRFLVQMVLYCRKLGHDNCHTFSISVSYILYKQQFEGLLNESQLYTFCGLQMTTEVHISFLPWEVKDIFADQVWRDNT